MQAKNGMTQAGEILLLVGSILQFVGAIILVVMAFILPAAAEAAGEADALAWVTWLYGILGAILIVGGVLAILGYTKARKGDYNGAFIFGLIASLLPPLQVVTFLGALFIKLGPDA